MDLIEGDGRGWKYEGRLFETGEMRAECVARYELEWDNVGDEPSGGITWYDSRVLNS